MKLMGMLFWIVFGMGEIESCQRVSCHFIGAQSTM